MRKRDDENAFYEASSGNLVQRRKRARALPPCLRRQHKMYVDRLEIHSTRYVSDDVYFILND